MDDKTLPTAGTLETLLFGDFLDLHRQHPDVQHGLEHSLFDTHFLNCSPLARRVRRMVLEAGFKLKTPETPLEVSRFTVFSSYMLPVMYSSKTIYFQQNAMSLEALSQDYPHFKNYPVKYIVPNLENVGNKILHESTHFLNFKHFFGNDYLNFQKSFTESETVSWLLTHLAIESAVLAVELMSTLVSQSVTNDYARYISSYQVAVYPRDYDNILIEGFRKMGVRQTFQVLCYGFLASNLFPTDTTLKEPDLDSLDKIFNNRLWVSTLTDRSFKLNLGFRAVSNMMYAFSVGYEKDYNELLGSIVWAEAIQQRHVKDIFDFNYELLIKPEFETP